MLLQVDSTYDSPLVTKGIFSLLAAAIYLMPTMVALLRSHHRKKAIILLNIFAGWTIFGWIGALVWSFLKVETKRTIRKKRNPV